MGCGSSSHTTTEDDQRNVNTTFHPLLIDAVDHSATATPNTLERIPSASLRSLGRRSASSTSGLEHDTNSSFVPFIRDRTPHGTRRRNTSPTTSRGHASQGSGSSSHRRRDSRDALNYSFSPSGEVMTYYSGPRRSPSDTPALSRGTSPSLPPTSDAQGNTQQPQQQQQQQAAAEMTARLRRELRARLTARMAGLPS